MDPSAPDFLEGLMAQASALSERLEAMKTELGTRTVESSVGGGMVVATVNLRGELVAIRIDPQVSSPADLEMLQDLIVAAVSQGQREAQARLADEIGGLTGGLGLPGLPGTLL